jgi:uncharacterized membrane protein YdbT with pleckstrin-like domain
MHFLLPTMRHPRNPLARALSLLIGLAVIGVLLVFGLVVAGVLLIGGLVLLAIRQWKHGGARVSAQRPNGHQPDVLEGEFVVVQRDRHATH